MTPPSLTQRLGVTVMRYTRHLWFSYGYPVTFLGSALSRRGTVACGCYCTATILLTCIDACAGRASMWQRTHVVLMIVCLLFFVTALTFEVLCAVGQLPEAGMRALTPWGFGGIEAQDDPYPPCGGSLRALPELVALCAAVIGWLLGVDAEADVEGAAADGGGASAAGSSAAAAAAPAGSEASAAAADAELVPALRPPLLTDLRHGALVGVLLIACAMLDCNLFAALYYAAALMLTLSLAWLETPSPLLARGLRGALLIAASLHLLTVVAFSFLVVLADDGMPAGYVVVLLGAEKSRWCFAQCLSTFVLFQVLLLCQPPARPAAEAVEVVLEERDTNASMTGEEELKRALISGDGAPTQASEAVTELSEVASAPPGQPRQTSQSARAVSGGLGAASRGRPLRPSASRPAAGVTSSFTSAQSVATSRRPPRLPQQTPRDVGPVVTHRPALTRSPSLVQSASSAVRLMFPWLVSAVSALGKSEFLPLLSLLSWPLVWPALPSLPLLVCGLLLLHLPLRRLPWWLFQWALAYEALFSVVIYAYNVYCQVVGMPPSAVPLSYTWAETLGLQSFSRMWESNLFPGLVRIGTMSLQSTSMVLLSLTCRFVSFSPQAHGQVALIPPGPEATRLEHQLWEGLVILMRNIFAGARLLTTGAVLVVACVPLNFSEAVSLFGLGYLLWVLCLAVCGHMARSEDAGWDALRAHVLVWRGLLVYSQCLVVALFCWQIFATVNIQLVGLRRSEHGVAAVVWVHIVVAVLAALQTRVLSAGVLQPSYLTSCQSLPAKILWYFGIFIEMALLFMKVFLPPVSVDSFMCLLLFILVVGIEQFSPTRRGRNCVLVVIAASAAISLPLRYAILIPEVQRWLSQHLRQVLTPDLLSVLALDVDEKQWSGACWKMAFTAVLLLFTSVMHRLFTSRCRTAGNLTFEWVPSHAVVVRSIIVISRGSTSTLMFVASFLMIQENLLSRLQLVVLTALLISGRRWQYAGAIISACSMALLLAQYISRFQFTFMKLTPEQAQYLGFVWDSDLVASEASLLLCGIAQGVLARTRAHLTTDLTSEALWERCRKAFAMHGAQIGATCVLLIAVFHRSVCSTLGTLVIIAYFLSRDSSRPLTAKRANKWLLLMASTNAFSLLYAWGMELWRPPLPFRRITSKDFAQWWICSMYDGSMYVDAAGIGCEPALEDPSCFTERQLCGQAWSQWLGLQRRGDLLSVFVSFFVVCLLRKACIVEIDHDLPPPTSRIRRMFSSVGAFRRRDTSQGFSSEASVARPSYRHASTFPVGPEGGFSSGDRPLTPLSVDQSMAQSTLSSAAELADRPALQVAPLLGFQPQALGNVQEGNGVPSCVTVFRATTLALWFSMIGAVTAQPQTDAIAILYLLLLFVHVNTMENTSAFRDPFQARVRVLRYIRVFNLVVCLVWIWYQCPLFPCPFALKLEPVEMLPSQKNQTTYFMSPEQCLQVQNSLGNGGFTSNSDHVLSIVLQCIGLRKTGDAMRFDIPNFWSALVFASSLALAVVFSSWRSQLSQEIRHSEGQMQMRECWYIEYLTAWRGLEISRIDTKHDVLHTKLKHLIQYLKEMRLVWSNRRPAPDDEEEHKRAEEERILDLCLHSGVQELRMKAAVQEFNAVVENEVRHENLSEECDYVRLVQEHVQAVVDDCVLEYFDDCALSQLHKITASAVLERKENLLGRVRKEAKDQIQRLLAAGVPVAAEEEEEDEVPMDAALPVTEPNTSDETPHFSAEPSFDFSLEQFGDAKNREIRQRTTPAEPAALNVSIASSAAMSPENVESSPDRTGNCCTDFWAALQTRFRSVCKFALDDLLFKTESDQTLWDHRRDNSIWQLAGKALQSQSLALLMVAAVLQFATYMSILSTVTVCAVLLSLFAFPHSPPLFWRLLKWYNMLVIILKMLFQLPVLCSNGQLTRSTRIGTLDNSGCPTPYHIPLAAIVGLRKVADGSNLAFDTLADALWADLLVCALLFFHWHQLWRGGRLGNPTEIRRHLDEEDSSRPRSPASPLTPSRTPRTSSFGVRTPRSPSLDNLQPTSRALRPSRESSFSYDTSQASVASMFRQLQESSGTQSHPLHGTGLSGNVRNPDEQEQTCLHRFIETLGSANVRRPALDLYAYRFWLAIVCLLILLTCWSYLSGSSRSFASSISGGNFSGTQVILAILFLAMIIIDRGLYTWSMQMSDRSVVTVPIQGGSLTASSPSHRNLPARVLAMGVQKLLLVTQLLVLHVLCIVQPLKENSLMIKSASLSLFDNPWLLLFYVLYIIFLALTSLQLKYQVYMTRGGLGLTHSTDIGTRLVYKVYCLMPFIEEVRVLTDWTMTQTSLDFFMWMKLEDAQQGLYRDACDMELREALPPGESRPVWEKVCQGGLLVLLLFCIIVGPLAFFSTLNFLLQPNTVSFGELSASLQVTDDGNSRRALLYEAGQASQTLLDSNQVLQFVHNNPEFETTDITVQDITFPASSDTYWLISQSLRQQFAEILNRSTASAAIVFQYTTRTSGGRSSTAMYSPAAANLNPNQTKDLMHLLNDTNLQGSRAIEIPDAMSELLHLDSAGVLAPSRQASANVNLSLDSHRLSIPVWSVSQLGGCDANKKGVAPKSCPFRFRVVADKIAPDLMASGAGSSTFTVTGIYIGVVYTIGRFLRLAFQDSSQRIIYEELPDTKILEDLCNGIYIARIQGDLEKEYELYYELIRIYRSPQLLLTVSGSKKQGGSTGDEDAILASRRVSNMSMSSEMRRRSHSFDGRDSFRAVVND